MAGYCCYVKCSGLRTNAINLVSELNWKYSIIERLISGCSSWVERTPGGIKVELIGLMPAWYWAFLHFLLCNKLVECPKQVLKGGASVLITR